MSASRVLVPWASLWKQLRQAKGVHLNKHDAGSRGVAVDAFETNIRVVGGLMAANDLDPQSFYVTT